MVDPFPLAFAWLAPMLAKGIPAEFPPGGTEHEILSQFAEQWGRTDTVELFGQLSAEYGRLAAETVERLLAIRIAEDWAAIGGQAARPGQELDDFVRLLWDPLPTLGFEYAKERSTSDGEPVIAFEVTRCPLQELAERTGTADWMYHLACASDMYSAPAFSSKIEFSRTRTLMAGAPLCDHTYRQRREP